MLGFEKDLFEEVVKSLEKAERLLGEGMSNGEKEKEKYQLVRFLEEVPEFLNMDGENVGPFERGEIVNLEKEIVEILINDGRVEVLEGD